MQMLHDSAHLVDECSKAPLSKQDRDEYFDIAAPRLCGQSFEYTLAICRDCVKHNPLLRKQIVVAESSRSSVLGEGRPTVGESRYNRNVMEPVRANQQRNEATSCHQRP